HPGESTCRRACRRSRPHPPSRRQPSGTSHRASRRVSGTAGRRDRSLGSVAGGLMARARTTAIAFDALSIEGALIAPDMLSRVAALQAGEQSGADYEVPEGLTLRDEIGRYFRIGEALWHRFDKVQDRDRSGIAAREFVAQLLGKVFGFTSLETARFEADGKS